MSQISKLKRVFFSKALGSFETKVHMKAYRGMGMKIHTKELGHMAIYGKNLLKSSSPEPIDR